MTHDTVAYTLTYGSRAWHQQWRQMRSAYGKLSAIYDGTTKQSDSEVWKTTAELFFLACHHLADWIENDPALPDAARQDAFVHLTKDDHLSLACDVSNTTKHLQRNRQAAKTAYVESVSTRPTSADTTTRGSIIVAWDVGGQRQGSCDALDLANACIRSWRTFLSKHGMNEPT